MKIKNTLTELCLQTFGTDPVGMTQLPPAGGDRRYFRIQLAKPLDTQTVTTGASACRAASILGAHDPNATDAKAFVRLSNLFREKGVNVPEVFAHTPDYSCYLVQDLGDISLFSLLGGDDVAPMVEATMRELVRMQTCCADNMPELQNCLAYPRFGYREAMWDLNYFKYEFLKNSDAIFDEALLEDDFESLASEINSYSEAHPAFMMRDCQSRNVMMLPGGEEREPYFIDFQGGRVGPGLYDAVSFLWQAKAGFSSDFRAKMLAVYADAYSRATGADAREILSAVPSFALHRTLQVLGAYGFRGLVQKRAHFVESIPGALRNLSELLGQGALDSYPELKRVARQLVDDPRFRVAESDGRLHVKVFSFSYKRGYPEDLTGNGGGFMFDCRGMHNPGRYEQYKQLTGLDKPVIDFLKECGEIDPFVERAVEIVAPTVDRYIKRGFASLQIGFGCTGGRHRSVYSAEAVAKALAKRFPEAVIDLCHREQSITRHLYMGKES